MKKFSKIWLCTALFLIIIGGTLCVFGYFTGGWRLANEIGRSSSWARLAWAIPGHYSRWHWGDWMDWEDLKELEEVEDLEKLEDLEELENLAKLDKLEELEDLEGIAESDAASNAAGGGNNGEISLSLPDAADYEDTGIRAADVKDLDVEIGGAALYIQEAEGDTFGIKTEGKGTYRYYEKNGKFHLEGNRKEMWDQYINKEERVYLYLPKGMVFREADIEMGGGVVEIASLSADEIDLSVGAGEIIVGELDGVELKVETGMGAVSLNKINVQKLDAETGLGSTYMKGSVSREIDMECGMGNIELILSGKVSDYNYEICCAVGSIDVDGRNYSGLAEDVRINNKAAAECSLECSMGEISLTFSE